VSIATPFVLTACFHLLLGGSKIVTCDAFASLHGKKIGFVTATKLGTTNNSFVAATNNFAAATKRFVDSTKDFVVVTKYFCYPYFNE